jgi:hypothetical protein
VSRVKVRIEGHYEVRELPYGRDYVWEPAHAVVECDCGYEMQVDSQHTTCPNCGTDHEAAVKDVAGRHLSEEVLHPWHAEYEEWLEFRENRTEYFEWREQRDLD